MPGDQKNLFAILARHKTMEVKHLQQGKFEIIMVVVKSTKDS